MEPMPYCCAMEQSFRAQTEEVRAFTYSDYAVATHIHDFYEVNVICGGTGTHWIQGNPCAVQFGDVFVIPPGVWHGYDCTCQLEVLHLLIRPSFFDRAAEWDSVEGLRLLVEVEPFLRHQFQKSLFLRLSAIQLLQMNSDFEILCDGGVFDFPGSEALKRHTVWKLLCLFSHLLVCQLQRQAKCRSTQNETAVIAALEYLHRHYGSKITIADLCAQTFLSRSSLMRSFKAVCGCSVMQYLRMYRRQKALEAFADTSKSKTEIAYECGFYDLSHMERVLRRTLDTEPAVGSRS